MSRPIKITQEYRDSCRCELEKMLETTKLTNGKFSFEKTFALPKQTANLIFTLIAWVKMTELIKEFGDEVAWHGVVHRGERNDYIVTDIIVYPQTVTGATVEMDTEMYASWLMENDDDERFKNIRMQGHSHVNMGTTPSGVDLSHQEEILNMMGDEDFYIFTIWNKSHSNWNTIYDLEKNVMFENVDIDVKIEGGINEFIQESNRLVLPKPKPIYHLDYNRDFITGGGWQKK